MRRQGWTFQQALKILDRMCGSSKAIRVAWMFSNRHAADYAMDMVGDIVRPLGEFAKMNRTSRQLTLQNGSSLDFHVADGDMNRFRGIRFDDKYNDNSVGEAAWVDTGATTTPRSSKPKSNSRQQKPIL